jgi:hypothetical protein
MPLKWVVSAKRPYHFSPFLLNPINPANPVPPVRLFYPPILTGQEFPRCQAYMFDFWTPMVVQSLWILVSPTRMVAEGLVKFAIRFKSPVESILEFNP